MSGGNFQGSVQCTAVFNETTRVSARSDFVRAEKQTSLPGEFQQGRLGRAGGADGHPQQSAAQNFADEGEAIQAALAEILAHEVHEPFPQAGQHLSVWGGGKALTDFQNQLTGRCRRRGSRRFRPEGPWGK